MQVMLEEKEVWYIIDGSYANSTTTAQTMKKTSIMLLFLKSSSKRLPLASILILLENETHISHGRLCGKFALR